LTTWDSRYLTLSEYDVGGVPTFKVEYAHTAQSPVKESFDICEDKVRAGAAEGRGAGAFQIFTTAGKKNYVFKPEGGSDLTTMIALINEKAHACNSKVQIIKEGTVMKMSHSIVSGEEAKFMVLRIVPPSTGGQLKQFVLEYISVARNMVPVKWDVCDPTFGVDNGGEHSFTLLSLFYFKSGRQYPSYTFRATGASETEKTVQKQAWIDEIKSLQDRCESRDTEDTLPQAPVVDEVDVIIEEIAVEKEKEEEPTAKLVKIDARTENLLQIKDMMLESAGKIPLDQTLVAFDFDLTLRDDNPEGGNMLRLEETTRPLLEWLKEVGAPAIVVTARNPAPGTWMRTWKQAEEQLRVADLLGQHVPTTLHGFETAEVEACPNSNCYVHEYKHEYSNAGGTYLADLKLVEGNGMVIAGFQKGEAILRYIETHGMTIKQVIFADDYATNAVNVARACEKAESIERVVGIWFAPFDVESGTKEFVEGVTDRTFKLKECLGTEKYSECKPKYPDNWCDSTMDGFLGDNSYNPRTPTNLYNVELVHLGHFPRTDEEREAPEAAYREAEAQEKEIAKMPKYCKAMLEKEFEDERKAKLEAMREAGVLPPCTSVVRCMQNKDKPPEKRKCDINAEACAHLLM
jgi:hypothetical protein